MDIYCAYLAPAKKQPQPVCQVLWPVMLAKLEGLAAFAARNEGMKVAVIPDAPLNTAATVGEEAQRTLNDLYLTWCQQQQHQHQHPQDQHEQQEQGVQQGTRYHQGKVVGDQGKVA